jgi:hypothetical protein
MNEISRTPVEEQDVVIHVERGMAGKVKIVESDKNTLPNEITVQVSRKRKASSIPVLGVIVK